jgi:hypothetical protein
LDCRRFERSQRTLAQPPKTILPWLFRGLLAALALTLIVALSADEPPTKAGLGVIEGTVTNQPDARRPWRYSRYYVKQAKTGELAEAVVALWAK